MKLQKKSLPFYFLIAIAILITLAGIFGLMTEPINSFYIILAGIGLILLILGITEERNDWSKILIFTSLLLYGFALFAFSYMNFQTNRFVSAYLFALSGVLVLLVAVIITRKKR